MFDPSVDQQFRLALHHHQAGQLSQAETLYQQVLSRQPQHTGALLYLGVLARQVGRHGIALDLIGRVLAVEPNNADALANLGNSLAHQKRLDEAIAVYQRSIALKPLAPATFFNLGNVLAELKQYDAAIEAYRRCVALSPQFAEAYSALAEASRLQGKAAEAVPFFLQAVALKPGLALTHFNLGNAFNDLKKTGDAIRAFDQALRLSPDFVEAHTNLGNAYRDAGNPDDAMASYRRAIELRPEHVDAWANLAVVLKETGNLDAAIAAYRKVIELVPDRPAAFSNLLYTVHYHPDFDTGALAFEHARWYAKHAAPLATLFRVHSNNRDPNRRLKVGYVSPDFRKHPVGRFILPLLANHDPTAVEVFAYSNSTTVDAMTEELKSHVGTWRDIRNLSDDQAAELILSDGIDVLVDLAMHSSGNRLLTFAKRPAPVQITYLAYCSSTGLKAIDYRLSDTYIDPPGTDESVYAEKTIRLPETYWVYQPIPAPEVGPCPVSGVGHITFGCLNNFTKIHELVLAAWSQIMLGVPGSRLLLHAFEGDHRRRVLRHLQKAGIDETRVHFLGQVPTRHYFEAYGTIDVALDPFPYNGGTTTCDALWMGVPVVSLIGRTGVGRAGSSILHNVGLQDLVASSVHEYINIAVNLSRDQARLIELRRGLRQMMGQSALMNAGRFALNVEAAYRAAWTTWCQGQ